MVETTKRTFDNTELKCFRACPTQHYYRHVLHLVPVRPSAALDWGAAMHHGVGELLLGNGIGAAVEAFGKAFQGGDELRTAEAGALALVEYAAGLPKKPWAPLPGFESEVVGERELTIGYRYARGEEPGAHTEELSVVDIYYGGRLDAVVEWGGELYVREFKTTTRFGKTYYNQFEYPNWQIVGYNFLAGGLKLGDRPIVGTLLDVLVLRKSGMELPPSQPISTLNWQVERFKVNTLRTVEQILAQEDLGFGERLMCDSACSMWSGCAYAKLCRSRMSAAVVAEEYQESKWDFRNSGGEKKDGRGRAAGG